MRAFFTVRAAALLALTAAFASATGCDSRSGGDDNGPPGPGGALTLTPKDAVVNVDGKNSATVTYQVMRGGDDVTAGALPISR